MEEPKFDPTLLKKKKKKKKLEQNVQKEIPQIGDGKSKGFQQEDTGKIYFTEEEKNALVSHHGVHQVEKKKAKELYSYDQMLSMLYGSLDKEETGKKTKIPLPHIQTDGFGRGIKTSITNYRIICKELGRDEQHLLLYLNVEIICKKKVSENGVLTLMGRYTQNEFLKVVKNYIIEYVDCKTCGRRHTTIKKEHGITFVYCLEDRCGGKRSVAKLNPK